jgi:glycerophosphoryl diester phosphodiesterase
MAVLPRAAPDETTLRACKLISHRGEHDNLTVFENTLRAFDIARRAGVWGIECDLRWTRDLQPVICHDQSTGRVFGRDLRVASLTFDELRAALPEVPTLAEVVQAFGGQMHLMLEVKELDCERLVQQRAILQATLGDLRPGQDFHILALDPDLFRIASFAGASTMLPVAEFNVARLSALALERGYAGIAGHFLLLGEALRKRHAAAGQVIGTGFPRSRRCLYREAQRGVEWVFSNDAVYLQGLLPQGAGAPRA